MTDMRPQPGMPPFPCRPRHRIRISACIALLCCLAAAAHAGNDTPLRLNQLQYIGSHNSYHAGLAPGEAAVLKTLDPALSAALDYRHPPLTKQFDHGVRQIELDIYADARGGRYAQPGITALVAKAGLPQDPPLADTGVMKRPGFKVMHIQGLDQRSSCQPLTACLSEVRVWSKAHPRHLPLFVLLETEQSAQHLPFPTVMAEPFDTGTLDALDAAIRTVFARAEYLTPDDVRGTHATLNAAVLAEGWPTLDRARGKVIFLLDQRAVGPAYLQGHPSLRGRVMFTNAVPGSDDAAFTELNDGDAESIARLVRQGYLVRSRTDADLKEARRNDTSRRDAMLASGAQLLSTDFPDGEPAANGYAVGFPGHRHARCNPQFTQQPCGDADLSP